MMLNPPDRGLPSVGIMYVKLSSKVFYYYRARYFYYLHLFSLPFSWLFFCLYAAYHSVIRATCSVSSGIFCMFSWTFRIKWRSTRIMTALTQDPHTDHFVVRCLTYVSNQELQLYVKEKTNNDHSNLLFTGRCAFKGNPNKGFTRNQNLVKGEHLAHNSNIEYACKVTYTLTGSNVLHCNDGKWNATVPSCKGMHLSTRSLTKSYN